MTSTPEPTPAQYARLAFLRSLYERDEPPLPVTDEDNQYRCACVSSDETSEDAQ